MDTRSTQPAMESQQNLRQVSRPRTYGKERSHLKDMVASIHVDDQPSSQQSLEHLASQVGAMANSKSQFDLGESGDEKDCTHLNSMSRQPLRS